MTDDVLATYDGALRAAHTRIAELERERDEAARLAERYMAGWQPDLNEALRERDELKATLDRMRLTDRMLAERNEEALEYGVAAPVAFDKMQALTRRAERAEAACAQMRAALENFQKAYTGCAEHENDGTKEGHCLECWLYIDARAALATDSGRALLERVRRYERKLRSIADMYRAPHYAGDLARAALSGGER